MRKRFALLWTPLILAMAMALPASTAAVSPATVGSYKVISNYCYGPGANSVYFKAKVTAYGSTNANYLTIDSWAQRYIGGHWQTVFNWNQFYSSYTPDGYDHWLKVWRSYQGNNSYYFRIVFNLRIWHNNTLLAAKTIHSFKC